MSFIQQVQSLSLDPQIKYMLPPLLISAQTALFIAGPIFAFLGATVIFTSFCFYLKDRIITRITAAALTLIIITLSISALFTPAATACLGIGIAIGTLCFTYLNYKALSKN